MLAVYYMFHHRTLSGNYPVIRTQRRAPATNRNSGSRGDAKTPFQAFPDHLDLEIERLRAEAEKLPQGAERDALLRKARQAETASHMNEWLSSPGLQPPR
jgi:hypothetical protein